MHVQELMRKCTDLCMAMYVRRRLHTPCRCTYADAQMHLQMRMLPDARTHRCTDAQMHMQMR